ncbi:MAG: hypothetical protein ABS46_18375 [Cytophagaceae bacterium SCN 52-12]|nr:MAG: hypothetical protein ABS46_18375 [Cytophagaceae bacterium SCN 52-12]
MNTFKKHLTGWSITIILLLFLAGCTGTEPCGNGIEDRTPIAAEDLIAPDSGVLTLQNIDESQDEVNLVLLSWQDFENYVESSMELPAIDFSKQVVLAGRKKWHQCIGFSGYSVQAGCRKVFYRVYLDQMDCLMLESVTFFTVISREAASGKVEFEIVVNQT